MSDFEEKRHRARKRFGQNFLVRDDIIHRIIQSVNPSPGDALVEIGPGLGALTDALMEGAGALQVIEIDRDLAARLRERGDERLTVHETDVLKVDFTELANSLASSQGNVQTNVQADSQANVQADSLPNSQVTSIAKNTKRLRIVGNLPYNISTPLLLKLAHNHQAVADIHVMLQAEVVDRMVATNSTRAFGRLSVILQSVFQIEQILSVPPDAFKPAPKVQSAVARLTPKESIPPAEELRALEMATRIAFGNKRKTLRNNFKNTLSDTQLQELDIDPGARAETLDLSAFHRLASVIVRLPPVKTL